MRGRALVALTFAASGIAAAEFPAPSDLLSTCEARWFLKATEAPDVRVLGFAYIDPEAGWSIKVEGSVALDAEGTLVRKPLAKGPPVQVVVRVPRDLHVACLSDQQASALGLPRVPDWLKHYEDTRPAGPHHVSWASFYNHIGATEKALEHLDAASAAGYTSPEFALEKGYALNANARFQEAVQVLEPAVMGSPGNAYILGECAFAHRGLKEYPRAIELYHLAISHAAGSAASMKAEYAHNLAVTYGDAGDEKNAKKWHAKSKSWQGKK